MHMPGEWRKSIPIWKMGHFDKAIEAIERAISIEPDNMYYKDQKEKFIETKKTASQSA